MANFTYEMRLQGTMVAVLMKTNIQEVRVLIFPHAQTNNQKRNEAKRANLYPLAMIVVSFKGYK